MSVDLRAATAEHLAERRARGYRLADHGWLLCSFLDGLHARGHITITVADAVAFAQARPATSRIWKATRLRAVRGLAAHVHALDPAAAELIPAGLIPANLTRRVPYLYSDEQIATLMSGAAALSPALLAAGMHALIGLLAVTGLRSGEAVALDVQDLDTDRRVLAVTGKYGKRRIVPLHPTTLEALAHYRQTRATAAPPTGALLIAAKGGRLSVGVAEPARADGVLAREFNRMLARLEGAARERTAFLATVSHELRTPVTIARGHVETLERSAADDPARVRATAGVIREELTHVGRLVDDLLALARAQLDDFVVPHDVALDRFFADLERGWTGWASRRWRCCRRRIW